MFGKVTISGKEVEMVANGATCYRYQAIFHEDYLKKMTSQPDAAVRLDVYAKMGFVMAMQAAKKDMNKLNVESYFKWLEEFEPDDIFLAVDDIANLYNGTTESTVDPK
jgi:hypothetical protein